MDQLHLINVFVAVVDTNGFAGAARKLNISPPAVTRAINELESHLGVRLLTRTTRSVSTTRPSDGTDPPAEVMRRAAAAGLDVVADNGAVAVIQPGGSMRDEEVIAAANERGIAMVFTGIRHFRH